MSPRSLRLGQERKWPNHSDKARLRGHRVRNAQHALQPRVSHAANRLRNV